MEVGKMSRPALCRIWAGWLLFFAALPAYGQTVITMATGEWIPLSSENMENHGEFTHRVSRILQEMDIKPDYRFYPWTRCFDAVVKGRVWAAFPYAYTPERAEKVWYSEPLSCSRTYFFYYDAAGDREPPVFNKLVDLKPYRLGGVNGYYYEKRFKRAGLTVDYVNKEIYGLEKLIRGRIDLMAINERVARHLIHTHLGQYMDSFKFISPPLSENSLYLVVSKAFPGSRELLMKFNATLKKCIENRYIEIDPCN